MGSSVKESREAARASLLVRVNVVLIALLTAALAFAAVALTAGTASASHGTNLTSAADFDHNGCGCFKVRYTNIPVGFEDATLSAVDSWAALGTVRFTRNNDDFTLRYRNDNDPETRSRMGEYFYYPFTADVIEYYPANVDRENYGTRDRRWLGRHETGHAFGLKHPVEIEGSSDSPTNAGALAAAQDCCVMHTYHNEQNQPNPGVYYLTTHDNNHYYAKWGG